MTPGVMTPVSSESVSGLEQDGGLFPGALGYNRFRANAMQRKLPTEQNAAHRASQVDQDLAFARFPVAPVSHARARLPNAPSPVVLKSDLPIRHPMNPPKMNNNISQILNPPFMNTVAGPSNSHMWPSTDLEPNENLFGVIGTKVEPGVETKETISGIPNYDLASPSSSDDSSLLEISREEFAPRVHPILPLPPPLAHSVSHTSPGLVEDVQSIQNLFFPTTTTPEMTIQMPGAWPDVLVDSNYPPWPSPSQALNQYRVESPSRTNTFGATITNIQNRYRLPVPTHSIPPVPSNNTFDPPTVFGGNRHIPELDYLSADPTKNAEEINKLLENIRPDEDLPPEMREGTPDSLKLPLLEHQKLGLAWLKQQEESSTKGGILADDMGLGKTIQALALMVTRRSEDLANKTTLIVAPVALLRQWESEIKDKLKGGRHALTVYKHHGPSKKSFDHLRKFDVVLTTFGSLAAEFKRKEHWEAVMLNNPNARPTTKEQMSLIGSSCQWYRVIVDEAQCIKNKDTQTAKAAYLVNAKYRWCMTGTPMMNNVAELYSLIRFCQVRPFNDWPIFRDQILKPLTGSGYYYERKRDNAMKQLQSIIRAIMLRRTKKSKIDGKPILQLPDRTVNVTNVAFNKDENEFYSALEARAQLQFNRYLKEGSVMKNYATALVLLLRLRQACCHPHLVQNWDPPVSIGLTPRAMEELAKQLSEAVVTMIKAEEGNFMCPICMDTAENPAIFIPCGHDTCTECFSRLTDPSNAIASGSEGTEAKCPECRAKVDPKKVIDFTSFKTVHQPHLLMKTEEDTVSDDSESDNEETHSESESLNGFIVSDDEEVSVKGEEEDDEDELSTVQKERSKKKSSKHGKDNDTKKGNGKGKKTHKSLAQLKAEGMRNKKARVKYFRQLQEDWIPSSKIDQTMALLAKIHQRKPVEKVLIFSQFTSLLDLLEIPISAQGYGYRRYDGSMSANDRNDSAQSFKESSTCTIMLISLKAGNAGLNLNCASQVIILDPFWNPFIEEQAIDRAHRIGQMRTVQVHRILVSGTVEDRILQMQEKKRELINEALDENAGKNISRLGVRELTFLFFGANNSNNGV
jgi:SNF2 family DNA or RNA helicase